MTSHTKAKLLSSAAAMRNIGVAMLIVLPVLLMIGLMAGAAEAPVGLGTADSFAVLAGSTVTNTGPTLVSGDLGVSPGTAVTGFPPGVVTDGTIHAADAVAAQAQEDLTTAYNDAAGRSCDEDLSGQDLGGKTLTTGVYCFAASAQLTGPVTFDAQGVASAVFIVQVGSTLTTASSSSVNLINGAQDCNVFWQVGSSATLGTNTSFRGTILALTSITLNTGATLQNGRALARNGAVTMDTNAIRRDSCSTEATPTPTSSPTPTPSATPTPTATSEATPTPTPTSSPAATPTPSVTPAATPTPTPTPIGIPLPTPTPAPTPTPTPTSTPTATPTSSPAPTPTPSVTPAATPTPTPTATPAATGSSTIAPSPAGGPEEVGGRKLPRSGAYIGVYLLLALALIAGGEVMRRWARSAT